MLLFEVLWSYILFLKLLFSSSPNFNILFLFVCWILELDLLSEYSIVADFIPKSNVFSF